MVKYVLWVLGMLMALFGFFQIYFGSIGIELAILIMILGLIVFHFTTGYIVFVTG